MRSDTTIPLDAWMTRLGLHLPVQVRVYAAFFLYAFSMGGFYPRLPELQVQMGVGEGTLGLAIMGVAAGMLVSLTFFVPQLERMRSRTVLLTTLPVISIAFALASHMRAAVAVFFFLFLVGLVMGFIETIVNLEADRIEHQAGTRIMNRSHGFWSIGFFAGGCHQRSLCAFRHIAAESALGDRGRCLSAHGFIARPFSTNTRAYAAPNNP